MVSIKSSVFDTKKTTNVELADKLNRPFYKNIKKMQLNREIRDALRNEFNKMYSSAENAYGALDFTGVGYIS